MAILGIADTFWTFVSIAASIAIVSFLWHRMCIADTFLAIFSDTRYQYFFHTNLHHFSSVSVNMGQIGEKYYCLRFENSLFLRFMIFGLNERNLCCKQGNDRKHALLGSAVERA